MSQELRVLLLTANPRGTTQLRLDEEAREIDEGLRRSNLRSQIILRSHWAVRPRDIRRALLDYEPDVVHFSGHGIGQEGLAFEDEGGSLALVPTDALASLFELFTGQVKCVVLNACFSEVQARAIANHVNHVIGMQRELGDRAAIEFAVGFYDAFGAGKSVPIAYKFGCNAIRLMGLDEHETPILVTKSDPSPAITFGYSGEARSGRVLDTTTRGDASIQSVKAQSLGVSTIEDVLRWGWDGEKLLEVLIRLDYQTTEDLTQAHEGDPRQWGPVFMNHPETWRLLTTGPQAIVGYWHWAPLFPSDYLKASSGELLDSEITVDKVQFFEFPGTYDVYFVQVCMLPEFRKPKAVQLLFDTVFEVIEGLSEQEIYVREVAANAYTGIGEALCRGFNLQPACAHVQHGTIFKAPIREILKHPLALRRLSLIRNYRDQGLA